MYVVGLQYWARPEIGCYIPNCLMTLFGWCHSTFWKQISDMIHVHNTNPKKQTWLKFISTFGVGGVGRSWGCEKERLRGVGRGWEVCEKKRLKGVGGGAWQPCACSCACSADTPASGALPRAPSCTAPLVLRCASYLAVPRVALCREALRLLSCGATCRAVQESTCREGGGTLQ